MEGGRPGFNGREGRQRGCMLDQTAQCTQAEQGRQALHHRQREAVAQTERHCGTGTGFDRESIYRAVS